MFYVVCDSNGECKGIFILEEVAHKVADYFGAYVSEHEPLNLFPSEVDAWLTVKRKVG